MQSSRTDTNFRAHHVSIFLEHNYLLARLNEMRPRVESEVRSKGVTAPIKSLCELDDVRKGTEVVLVGTVAKVLKLTLTDTTSHRFI